MTSTAGSSESLEQLRGAFSGSVIEPGEAGYDEARRVHNGLIDRRPALIARCQSTADIADAVRFARDEGLDVSVRGGGHNVAGRAVIDGAVMLDLSLMKGIFVDPVAQTGTRTGRHPLARAQPGDRRSRRSRRPAARSRPPESPASRSAAGSAG